MSPYVAPLTLAEGLADFLSKFPPDERTLKEAMTFVRKRRDERGEPLGRKGHEYVVERLLRPVVTGWVATQLGLSDTEVALRVNSSHFHTCDDDKWPNSWRTFQKEYRNVDTHDERGHLRRADLFICTSGQNIVSIEFKYVAPRRVPARKTCARQVRQYLRLHKASILVIYAALPASSRLNTTIDEIRRQIGKGRAFVVALTGPPVKFP